MLLACMEAEKENTESIALFLKLFNKVLCEIKGNKNYKWKPHGMMCNESGTNFQAISKVFGREFLGSYSLLSMAFLAMCQMSCKEY